MSVRVRVPPGPFSSCSPPHLHPRLAGKEMRPPVRRATLIWPPARPAGPRPNFAYGVCFMRRICCRALLLLPLLSAPALAATTTLEVAVDAGKHDRTATPVSCALTLPA